MLAEQMLAFRKIHEQEGVILCYCGAVTEQVLLSVGNSLKSKLAIEKTDKNIARSLFAIFVEQTQNVIRYSIEKSEGACNDGNIELAYGLITVGKTDGEYFVACGNLIKKMDVPRLKGDLSLIRSMDKDSLKALYKQTLKGEIPEHSKGAGVGFIDIARKSSRGFEFDF
ncbi:MAG: hypothetical protein HQK60_19840, partial [Deltaproteobacteria bacterium]|nr:hypothetical protein [Deltaproteobacteria bacterium]